MYKQMLNGIWDYRIGKGEFAERQVPFSCLAVGHSEVKRSFDLEGKGERIFLKFEGITYAATVFLNGEVIGEMLPYSEYSFEITSAVREKENILLVELEDLSPAFGPTAGWENFGGIIRDVYLEYKNENYIEDVFAYSTLENNFSSALLTVEAKCGDIRDSEYEISLFYKGERVCSYTCPAEEKITQKIENIHLWSPDSPELYELKVTLLQNGKEQDTYSCNIGFREITCDKHFFYLNGEKIFLKGVCKHEMVANSGHCPTYEQTINDMRMIKETGCNFVRLVHYPHSKTVLDIADKLGLLVSEEPGLWWSNTSDPQVSAGSIEVLRRTVLRDRNRACVAFWLCFNECEFTEQFLIDSANICRKYDPTRMVSGANCMSDEDTKKFYNICGFDFYTMHPYAQSFDRSMNSAKYLNDKPLVFTEWGGHFLCDNLKLMSEFLHEMNNLYMYGNDDAALAGAFFWFWAELNDFNRGKPACIDGNLHEGLVTSDRKPTPVFDAFCKGIKNIGSKSIHDPFWFEGGTVKGKTLSCEQQRAQTLLSAAAQRECEKPMMRSRRLIKLPVTENVKGIEGVPYVVADGSEPLIFDFKGNTDAVTLIGLVSMDKGYPLGGEYGEEVATLTVNYENGQKQEFILKNGIDVTTVFALKQSSRINPVAEKSLRFAQFGYDKNFENYIMNIQSFKTDAKEKIKNIILNSCNNGYTLIIYAISV